MCPSPTPLRLRQKRSSSLKLQTDPDAARSMDKKGYGFKRISPVKAAPISRRRIFGNRLLGFNVHLKSFNCRTTIHCCQDAYAKSVRRRASSLTFPPRSAQARNSLCWRFVRIYRDERAESRLDVDPAASECRSIRDFKCTLFLGCVEARFRPRHFSNERKNRA